MGTKRPAAYGADFVKRRKFQKVFAVIFSLALLAIVPFIYLNVRSNNEYDRKELLDFFEEGAYERAYFFSMKMLSEQPMDFFLLTIHGFSAYQLAVAQINNFDTLSYVNDCIWALRKALIIRENSPEIFYVLGKAYYYKGQGYADLAVNYLEKARDAMFMTADIPEYLGLSYAALRDYRSSVAAFTLALTNEERYPYENPSDELLLSIVRSYLALEEYDLSRAYLMRCIEISRDSRTIETARLLLADIMIKTGDYMGAEKELMNVLDENGENAEAYYQLGVLYAFMGDATRARAQWRRAISIDPAHGPARDRLNL